MCWKSRYGVSDTAIESIFRILSTLFLYLSQVVGIPFCAALAGSFPKTILAASRIVGLESNKFEKFVVCQRCHFLYTYEDCFQLIGSRRMPKQCSHVQFSCHPQRQYRQPCNEVLFRQIKSSKQSYFPLRTYCYRSIQETLLFFVKRPGFADACEVWRCRDLPEDVLADVYDGAVWKQFQYVDGDPFLAMPRNYGFMLNVDWYQPFKQSPYSIGVIYLVLLNLPRAMRFKKEIVFVVGIIPGPQEPSLTINGYLRPLVGELDMLWTDGVCLPSASSPLVLER